jgi:hypothetical protein
VRDLSSLTTAEARGLERVLFDLDDTFLEEGRVVPEALASLVALAEAGLGVIAVTGRPASWGELLARSWPIEAAVAENGALCYWREGKRVAHYDPMGSARPALRARLDALVTETRALLPRLVPADDVAGRVSDFTFDIGEHELADEDDVRRAIELARACGARTTRSSVHLHLTFDRCDKATGTLDCLCRRGVDPTRALFTHAYVGDSTNDAPCFAAFRTSVGVRNLRGSFSVPPRYVTRAPRAAGFIELAQHLCRLRTAP